jgi:hypothetical protein
MITTPITAEITIDDILDALRRLPPDRLPDVLQFIEFIEYQVTQAETDTSEDEALWAAVEAEQAYRREHPEEVITLHSTDELKAFLDSDE